MNKDKALLAKAKQKPGRVYKKSARFSEDQVNQLALAYLSGEITFSQVVFATGHSGTSVYALLAPALRRLYAAGKLRITK
jgi:hypothetical protein